MEPKNEELKRIAASAETTLLEIGTGEYDEETDEYTQDIHPDIMAYINEGVLSIERVQDLQSDGWITSEYILCTGCGGPGVYVRTDGTVKVVWWGDSYRYNVGPQAKAVLEDIFEYLDEVYSCQ